MHFADVLVSVMKVWLLNYFIQIELKRVRNCKNIYINLQ